MGSNSGTGCFIAGILALALAGCAASVQSDRMANVAQATPKTDPSCAPPSKSTSVVPTPMQFQPLLDWVGSLGEPACRPTSAPTPITNDYGNNGIALPPQNLPPDLTAQSAQPR